MLALQIVGVSDLYVVYIKSGEKETIFKVRKFGYASILGEIYGFNLEKDIFILLSRLTLF